jgi:hypothetical protein
MKNKEIKQPNTTEASNDFYTLLASRLNQLKEIGYHRRESGSTFLSDKKVKCDCCGRPTNIKIGYEKDYPKNVDIGLCSACSDELDDLYGS